MAKNELVTPLGDSAMDETNDALKVTLATALAGKSCRYHLEGYGPQLFWRHSQHTVSCGLAYTGLTKGCHEGHYSI